MLQAAKFLSVLNVAQKMQKESDGLKLRQEGEEVVEAIEIPSAPIPTEVEEPPLIMIDEADDIEFGESTNAGEGSMAADAMIEPAYYEPEPYYYHDDYSWLY